ncbi:hypothetical protein, partial [Aeromonas sp. DNP9]|uniref:hypothetical protein n=1 Tax=Aeromonas sp. DNP9 TaxID=1535548 RepID=UPI001C0C0BA2
MAVNETDEAQILPENGGNNRLSGTLTWQRKARYWWFKALKIQKPGRQTGLVLALVCKSVALMSKPPIAKRPSQS